MKTVKALVAFSNGVISMEQYEVRELPTDMANDLIAAGICVDAAGGSGGGVLVVHDVDGTLDKTWQEIHDAMLAGVVVIELTQTDVFAVQRAYYYSKTGEYKVNTDYGSYNTSSAGGYPARSF